MVLIRSVVLLSFLLPWTLTAEGMAAERRIALVIGNGSYRHTAPLKNPPHDAQLMARTLSRLGFKVIELVDGSREQMLLALRQFGDLLEKGGDDAVGLFYYAGHGVQVNGRNYMIPITAEIKRESDVEIYAVNANAVLGTMGFARNRLNFMILDACRNNPFARSFRSATQGLARMDAPRGTLIAYATAPGEVAADGKGQNSPYTQALTEAMKIPGMSVEHMFKRSRLLVMEATRDLQVPWESSSLTGEFYFNPAAPTVAAQPAAPAPVAREALELSYWQSIKDSPSKEDLKDFLGRFPDGVFSTLARRRLNEMEEPESARPERKETIVEARLSPGKSTGSSKYDGLWIGERICPRGTRKSTLRVIGGKIDLISGTPGEPGYRKLTGAVSSDGTLQLKAEAVNLQGLPITMEATGQFSDTSFKGRLTFEHPVHGREVQCELTLARSSEAG